MKLKDIMTKKVEVVPLECTVREAAEKMKTLDVGAIPVTDGKKLLGLLTDRDIALKVVAEGRDADETKVTEVMTSPIVWTYDDMEVGEAARLMEVKMIRRILIVNRDKKLVGIVALGDIATRANEEIAGEILERVSEQESFSQEAHP
ncbi:MAG: CBS domain-containing protein [Bdellovibrionaceae bacterium]|nr:CBS domain-containing protein [Pseudobdellovibrionaceae bacterium]MBX3034175.1 CBS domain-containing protein [Pseudobdellovibrionaceae bacterium]